MMTQRVGVSSLKYSLTLGRVLGIAGLLCMTGGLVAPVAADTTDPDKAPTAADWLAQLESEPATITHLRLTPTDAGLTLTIEANGVLPAPTLETLGNAQIVTIPNTVLSLPAGEERFHSQPAEGIAAVAVSTDGNAVRLAIN
ncbi:AMIN domain-containing protein [Halomicronema hongdechloris]|nr:AMIN domain-containing protein [Halomicronema hongdechloris]